MEKDLLVETPCGILQGCVDEGVYVFRGVPYAKPPTGPRRFRDPIPTKWDGVRDATQSGPAAYQVNNNNMTHLMDLVKAMHPGELPGIVPGPPYVFETYEQSKISEDCLYLDIWKSANTASHQLPVYVYYHGGANIVSAGSFQPERGAALANEEGIIVVRPNYRMGALGWVHFGLISKEYPEAINLGLKDQIAALKWVHENISSFGGDQNNITIGGESAGATAVSHLLCNPVSQKLVRRAIVQSLSPFNVWCTQEKQEAEVIARKYMDLLQIHDDPARLSDTEPEKFLAIHSILLRLFSPDTNHAWSPVGAVVDGDIVPSNPALMLSTQPYPIRDFELMIGFAKDEWQFFRGHSATFERGVESDAISILAQVFGEREATSVFQSYKKLYPSHSTAKLLNDVMSMQMFKFSFLAIASNFASQNLPVYVFQFSFELSGGGGAIHTGDMPFIFRNYTDRDLKKWPAFKGTDPEVIARLSHTFGGLYGSFIRQGCPGTTDSWPVYDDERQAILWFGETIEPVQRLLEKEIHIFKNAGIVDYSTLLKRMVRNVRKVARS
jgi:para-nitrobenzyl esterase